MTVSDLLTMALSSDPSSPSLPSPPPLSCGMLRCWSIGGVRCGCNLLWRLAWTMVDWLRVTWRCISVIGKADADGGGGVSSDAKLLQEAVLGLVDRDFVVSVSADPPPFPLPAPSHSSHACNMLQRWSIGCVGWDLVRVGCELLVGWLAGCT